MKGFWQGLQAQASTMTFDITIKWARCLVCIRKKHSWLLCGCQSTRMPHAARYPGCIPVDIYRCALRAFLRLLRKQLLYCAAGTASYMWDPRYVNAQYGKGKRNGEAKAGHRALMMASQPSDSGPSGPV